MKRIPYVEAQQRARIAAEEFVAAISNASSAIEPYYPGYRNVWTVEALVPIFIRVLNRSYEIVPDSPVVPSRTSIERQNARAALAYVEEHSGTSEQKRASELS